MLLVTFIPVKRAAETIRTYVPEGIYVEAIRHQIDSRYAPIAGPNCPIPGGEA